eukprot:8782462-Pyramimonas_sp.AAC.1
MRPNSIGLTAPSDRTCAQNSIHKTHAVLCHAIAQWRDRPRASISKRQHIGSPLFGDPCGAMSCYGDPYVR